MPYTPPVYPSAIPSQTGTGADLPDRVDDIDWLYAARYNELKKEICAIMTELGTLPKGSYADVKARLAAAVPQFHDRGDPSGWDLVVGSMSTDGAWHDWDLSAIVPAGTTAVLLAVQVGDDAIDKSVAFRKNGNTNTFNAAQVRTQVANQMITVDVIVACDTNRVIEYWTSSNTFSNINILVRGYWS